MDAVTSTIIAPDSPAMDDLAEMLEAEVTKVFDGDGFLAKLWHPTFPKRLDRVPCRFAFIDAPEMQQPFGEEARRFLHDAIAGKTLRLNLIGKESTGGIPIDGFKRILCMGYLAEELETGEIAYFIDGKCGTGVVKKPRPVTRNIELEMIINGWAWVVRQYSFDREEEYFAAQDDARQARRGLWAADKPQPPWQFKQQEKRRRMAAERQPSLKL
jgi:endonuclease YncB( thermonuclease family)